MKVAVVGATGLVGTKMLQVLAERNFPVDELIAVASERSIGKEVEFKGKRYKIVSAADAITAKPDVAIFSVYVYNTLGQLMQINTNLNNTIDVSSLKTGNYFIKILSDKGSSIIKFIKE